MNKSDKIILGCFAGAVSFCLLLIILIFIMAPIDIDNTGGNTTDVQNQSSAKQRFAEACEKDYKASGLDVTVSVGEYERTFIVAFHTNINIFEFDMLMNQLQKDYGFNKNLKSVGFDRVIFINGNGQSRSWRVE